MFLVALLGALTALCLGDSKPYSTNWYFQPVGESRVFDVRPGPPSWEVSRDALCCQGTVILKINLQAGWKPMNPAVWIPSIGGITSLAINGRVQTLSDADYSSVGPIVAFLDEKNPVEVRIELDGRRQMNVGPWAGDAVVGEFQNLIHRRDLRNLYQVYLPLALSAVLLALSLIFFWLERDLPAVDPLIREFRWVLLSWGIFYVFLSGVVRHISPVVGSILHLVMRDVAVICLIRLVLTLANIETRIFTTVLLFILVPTTYWGWIGRFDLQAFSHALLSTVFVFSAFMLFKNKKTGLQAIFSVAAFVAGFGFISDSYKLLGISDYDIPYLNRYLTPPLLLMSVFALAFRLKKSILSDSRKTALVEATEQLVHDLRTPLGALQIVGRGVSLPEEERTLFHNALDRIVTVTRSLKGGGERKKRIDLVDFLGAMAMEHTQVAPSHENADVRLIGTRAEVVVFLPEVEFSRVVSNLIRNAIESYRAGQKAWVQLSARAVGDHVVVEIVDGGRGVPSGVLKNFGRRGWTEGKKGGSGLGLYFAKTFCDQVDGEMSIGPSDPNGTRVVLKFPKSVE